MPLGIQEKPCVVAARPKAALIIETGLCPFALALAKKRAKVNGRKAGMCLFHIGNANGTSSAELIFFKSLYILFFSLELKPKTFHLERPYVLWVQMAIRIQRVNG